MWIFKMLAIYQYNCDQLKNHTHFKDTSLEWIALNLLDMLPKQNWVGKLTFSLLALNL